MTGATGLSGEEAGRDRPGQLGRGNEPHDQRHVLGRVAEPDLLVRRQQGGPPSWRRRQASSRMRSTVSSPAAAGGGDLAEEEAMQA